MATKKTAKTKKSPTKITKKTLSDLAAVKVSKAKLKIPKNLGLAADRLYEVKNARLAAQQELKPLGAFETELKEHIINTLPKSRAEGIAGRVARATIKKRSIPRIEDEKKFMAFAKKAGNEDLFKIVPNQAAIEERWEQGQKIPGVGTFEVISVGINKL